MLALVFNVGRIKKHPLALSFIVTSLILGLFIGAYDSNIFSYLIITMFTGAAVIIEPKTSPSKFKEQIIYGVSMALLVFVFSIISVPNPIVIALLIGNLALFFFKNRKL